MQTDIEAQSVCVRIGRRDCRSRRLQKNTIPFFDGVKFGGCNRDLFDADNLIGLFKILRNTLIPRRQILNQEWCDPAVASSGEGEQPLQFITVRPLARPWDRIVDCDPGFTQSFGITEQIIGLKTKVD